jgi:hypothetical protein
LGTPYLVAVQHVCRGLPSQWHYLPPVLRKVQLGKFLRRMIVLAVTEMLKKMVLT